MTPLIPAVKVTMHMTIISVVSAVPEILAVIDPFWKDTITPLCVLILGIVTVIMQQRNKTAIQATGKMVNGEMTEFKASLRLERQREMEEFKKTLLKANAFDAGTVKATAGPAIAQSPAPTEVKVVNEPSEPAQVQTVKKA